MEFNPIGGEELQDIASRIAGASPQVIAMVKEAIKIKDVSQLPGGSETQGWGGGREGISRIPRPACVRWCARGGGFYNYGLKRPDVKRARI